MTSDSRPRHARPPRCRGARLQAPEEDGGCALGGRPHRRGGPHTPPGRRPRRHGRTPHPSPDPPPAPPAHLRRPPRRAGPPPGQAYLDGVEPASIRWATNQTKRWGSCTLATREIRISSRLRVAPPWVLDAVIVHELAHLLEPGHSPRFRELESRYPAPARRRPVPRGVRPRPAHGGRRRPRPGTGAAAGRHPVRHPPGSHRLKDQTGPGPPALPPAAPIASTTGRWPSSSRRSPPSPAPSPRCSSASAWSPHPNPRPYASASCPTPSSRGIWLVGFALMLVQFGLQATALRFGQLSVVQPVLTTELLFLLLILGVWFRYRLGAREWIGAVTVVGRTRWVLPGRPPPRRPGAALDRRVGGRLGRPHRRHRRVHRGRTPRASLVAGRRLRCGHRRHRGLRRGADQGHHRLRVRGLGPRLHPLPALHAGRHRARHRLPAPERAARRADHRVADHAGNHEPAAQHRARRHPLRRRAAERGAVDLARGPRPSPCWWPASSSSPGRRWWPAPTWRAPTTRCWAVPGSGRMAVPPIEALP